MLSFGLDTNRLMRLATRNRLLPPGNDLGYALHAVFAASFHQLAPKPFALLPLGAQGREWRLLAYSRWALEELRAHASSFGDPDFLAPLDIGTAAAKEMPDTFGFNTRLCFRVRLRPTVRTGKPNKKSGVAINTGKALERDAYLAADPAQELDRGSVYASWLAVRLAAIGSTIETVSLNSFRRTRLMGRNRAGGEKITCSTEGPDATLSGTLLVTDTMAFSAGLAHGIGRHRTFGFGMLLLAPANG